MLKIFLKQQNTFRKYFQGHFGRGRHRQRQKLCGSLIILVSANLDENMSFKKHWVYYPLESQYIVDFLLFLILTIHFWVLRFFTVFFSTKSTEFLLSNRPCKHYFDIAGNTLKRHCFHFTPIIPYLFPFVCRLSLVSVYSVWNLDNQYLLRSTCKIKTIHL